MKLVKVNGIVIKEISYSDNDKIITLLTDELGLITCMAKGAKKTSSHLLASSQYLVYSEFILFKGTTFHHVNSASSITTFYKLRTDFDKISEVFPLTKTLLTLTDENMDTKEILKLFLNTLYLYEKGDKDGKLLLSIFTIKLLTLLGYSSNVINCSICGSNFKEQATLLYYDFVSNIFICQDCVAKEVRKEKYIKLNFPVFMAIRYIMYNPLEKIFSFTIDPQNINLLQVYGQAQLECILKFL